MSKRISYLRPLLCVYLCTVLLGMGLVVQSTHGSVAMAKSNVPLMDCNGYDNIANPPHESSPWGTVEGTMCYEFHNAPLPSGCHGNLLCWSGGTDTSIAAGGRNAPSIVTFVDFEDRCNTSPWMNDGAGSLTVNNTMAVAGPTVWAFYHGCGQTQNHDYSAFYEGYAASSSNGNGTAYGAECNFYFLPPSCGRI